MKAYKVTVNDHSSLGGPMGSERVYQIMSKYFKSKVKAKEWLVKDAMKRTGKLKEVILKNYGDLDSYGYDIEIVTIEG